MEFANLRDCYPQLEIWQKQLSQSDFQNIMTEFITQITEKKGVFQRPDGRNLAAAYQFGKDIMPNFGKFTNSKDYKNLWKEAALAAKQVKANQNSVDKARKTVIANWGESRRAIPYFRTCSELDQEAEQSLSTTKEFR